MTREEFIKILEEERYSYKIWENKIVVTHKGTVDLRDLTSLPPGVVFNNGWAVNLTSLTSLPPGVEFRNEGYVYLSSLTSLPPNMEFRNEGYVGLESLTSLPPGVVFNNRGYVYLRSLIRGGFQDWEGNIYGIDSNRLLNKMISLGLFERKI
jgi:hypothetical protein